MAIDYTGISSLETGAPDIKLTGNQDPREPNQKFAGGGQRGWMAQELAMEIAEEEYGRDFYDLNDSLQMKIYSRALQEIDDMLMDKMGRAQNREGIQMASAADPMLQEEYDKYVFEMQEMGQQPMSFEQFRQQAVAGMATGGRVGFRRGGDTMEKKDTKTISAGHSMAQFGHAGHGGKTETEAKAHQQRGIDTPKRGPGSDPNLGQTKVEAAGYQRQKAAEKEAAAQRLSLIHI